MPSTSKKIVNFKTQLVANILKSGGVVSLPTDTIQGLSCLPETDTLIRLITLKHRSEAKGLILISANVDDFKSYVEDISLLKNLKLTNTPTTYIIKANKNVSKLLLGEHNTVAIRLTNNALIKDLCACINGALVSTSANISGLPVAQSILKLRVYFKNQLDYIITPNVTSARASAIIDLHTGERLR